jgi:hypothetical protein
LARLLGVDSKKCAIIESRDKQKELRSHMFMKKKIKKCCSPTLGALIALPLLAVGAALLMKKKGKSMLHAAKCCCEAGEDMLDEMTK